MEELENIQGETQEEIAEIKQIRIDKLRALADKGEDPFRLVKYDKTHQSTDIIHNYEALEGQEVSIAGRMVSRRIMGKASFLHILDDKGKIQVYLKKDDIGEDKYLEFKTYDIGDILGIVGKVFRTRMGEISVHATKVVMLAKSLLPLPEKYHGLRDTDLRYRQRYVDLIANPDVKNTFILRSKIISAIRAFLEGEGFLEVDTPILNTIAGGANAKPFITHHNTLDIDMYMRIAPELYLKRLIVGGFEKVYEMGRLFRNEGMSIKHNPEFTTMELYQAYVDYHAMMDITERLFVYVAQKVLNTTEITYQGTALSLARPWTKKTMAEAVKEHTGIDFMSLDIEEVYRQCDKKGIDIAKNLSWGKAMAEIFDTYVEDKLIQPTFIIDYPVEISPLAKKKPEDGRLTERFELFMTAREYANAFSELNDPFDQRERFLAQVKEREKGDEEAQMMDEDYINALEYGLPPTGGLGIGIDRMIMLYTDSYSIRDVLLFPTMKPLNR